MSMFLIASKWEIKAEHLSLINSSCNTLQELILDAFGRVESIK